MTAPFLNAISTLSSRRSLAPQHCSQAWTLHANHGLSIQPRDGFRQTCAFTYFTLCDPLIAMQTRDPPSLISLTRFITSSSSPLFARIPELSLHRDRIISTMCQRGSQPGPLWYPQVICMQGCPPVCLCFPTARAATGVIVIGLQMLATEDCVQMRQR